MAEVGQQEGEEGGEEGGVIAKTAAREKYALSDKDLIGLSYTQSGKSKLYNEQEVRAAAAHKYGSITKVQEEVEKRVSKQLTKKRKRETEGGRTSRKAELEQALLDLGLLRRADSKLCDAYEGGGTSKTAGEVAVVMARMKYLHEYPTPFDEKLNSIDQVGVMCPYVIVIWHRVIGVVCSICVYIQYNFVYYCDTCSYYRAGGGGHGGAASRGGVAGAG
jgi:hypothetical protein